MSHTKTVRAIHFGDGVIQYFTSLFINQKASPNKFIFKLTFS